MSNRRLQLVTYEDGSAGVDLLNPASTRRVLLHALTVALLGLFATVAMLVVTTLVLVGLAIVEPQSELWVVVPALLPLAVLFITLPLPFGSILYGARGGSTIALRVDHHGLRLDDRLIEWSTIEAIDGDDVTLEITHADTVRLDLSRYTPEDVQRLRGFLRSTLASRTEIPEDPAASRAQLRRLIGASVGL